METTVEVLEGNRTKVTVTVDGKEIGTRVKNTYKDFANKYTFPGFRKGKAPRPVIDNALGKDAVRATVTDDVINGCYPLAIDESGLYPVGQPDFEEAVLVVDGQDYAFSFTVEVKPSFELSSYEPVEIKLPAEGASEAEIQEQIDMFREHYFSYADADADAVLAADGCADVALAATDDKGEAIEALTSDSRLYTLGQDMMPAAFDEALAGLKAGDTAHVVVDVPAEEAPIMVMPFAGKTATISFDVTVNTVKKKELPEVTDAWVKESLGFESAQELHDVLARSIAQQKESALPRMKETAVLEAIGPRLEGEPPDSLVEEAESTLLQDFFQQLQNQGSTFDAYLAQQQITADQFKNDVKVQAADVARQDLALDAWARHFELVATDEDVEAEFKNSGANDPKALFAQWRSNGQLHVVREAVLRTKAVKDLMDKAIVNSFDLTETSKDEGAAAEAPAAEEAPAEEPAGEQAAEQGEPDEA